MTNHTYTATQRTNIKRGIIIHQDWPAWAKRRWPHEANITSRLIRLDDAKAFAKENGMTMRQLEARGALRGSLRGTRNFKVVTPPAVASLDAEAALELAAELERRYTPMFKDWEERQIAAAEAAGYDAWDQEQRQAAARAVF